MKESKGWSWLSVLYSIAKPLTEREEGKGRGRGGGGSRLNYRECERRY